MVSAAQKLQWQLPCSDKRHATNKQQSNLIQAQAEFRRRSKAMSQQTIKTMVEQSRSGQRQNIAATR